MAERICILGHGVNVVDDVNGVDGDDNDDGNEDGDNDVNGLNCGNAVDDVDDVNNVNSVDRDDNNNGVHGDNNEGANLRKSRPKKRSSDLGYCFIYGGQHALWGHIQRNLANKKLVCVRTFSFFRRKAVKVGRKFFWGATLKLRARAFFAMSLIFKGPPCNWSPCVSRVALN